MSYRRLELIWMWLAEYCVPRRIYPNRRYVLRNGLVVRAAPDGRWFHMKDHKGRLVAEHNERGMCSYHYYYREGRCRECVDSPVPDPIINPSLVRTALDGHCDPLPPQAEDREEAPDGDGDPVHWEDFVADHPDHLVLDDEG